MPITFNIDLTKRRKEAERQELLQKQQDAFGGLTSQLFGAPTEGPPTAAGLQSRIGVGALPPGALADISEAQLASGVPSIQQHGLTSAQGLLEAERQKQLALAQATQQQEVLAGITEGRPELGDLAALAGLPAFEDQAVSAFTKGVTPKDALAGGKPTVQSSRILDNGLVEMVFNDGAVKVVPASEENKTLIEEAQRFGAKLQGIRSGERAEGTQASKQAAKAYEGLAFARKQMVSMDKIIEELGAGANTGAVASRLPSFRDASIRLNNLQANMGLDILQNTTFGSLSAQELAFVLDTAIPQGLSEPALIEWATKKRAGLDKLSKYLEKAALFLGTPGNTIKDFLVQQRTEAFVRGQGNVTPDTPLPTGSPSAPPPPGQVIRQVR